MTRAETTRFLLTVSMSAAAIIGCTRIDTARKQALPAGEVREGSAEQVLSELEATLLDLEGVLAVSERWSLDPP
ncbi:MAG: hypothetical protein PVG04_05610 [Anaerolineales bacterium]|jgi:hypothetical protein